MERVTIKMRDLVRTLDGCSLEAQGLYLQLYALWAEKDWRLISSPVVEIKGKAITSKLVSLLLGQELRRVNKLLRELQKRKLVSLDPIQLLQAPSENEKYIRYCENAESARKARNEHNY